MEATTTRRDLLPLSPMARVLGVPAGWLRSEADAGRLPCVRCGRAYLFSRTAVEAALARQAGHEAATQSCQPGLTAREAVCFAVGRALRRRGLPGDLALRAAAVCWAVDLAWALESGSTLLVIDMKTGWVCPALVSQELLSRNIAETGAEKWGDAITVDIRGALESAKSMVAAATNEGTK